ncbi:MAG: hypothetical protein RL329_894 [Bacteroidota bacterium]
MKPHLNDGEYVFCTLQTIVIDSQKILCFFKETEAITIICAKTDADEQGFSYHGTFAWITYFKPCDTGKTFPILRLKSNILSANLTIQLTSHKSKLYCRNLQIYFVKNTYFFCFYKVKKYLMTNSHLQNIENNLKLNQTKEQK